MSVVPHTRKTIETTQVGGRRKDTVHVVRETMVRVELENTTSVKLHIDEILLGIRKIQKKSPFFIPS